VDFLDDSKKLDEILREAHRQRGETGAGTNWRDAVMARIGEIGPLDPSIRLLPAFGELVWRLVPVTSLLALVLICLLVTLGTSWSDPLEPLINAAEESLLFQIFGVSGGVR
jgi:hypothetical protein